MTDMEFAEEVYAHPGRQIFEAAVALCGDRLQDLFASEIKVVGQRFQSELSPEQLCLLKSMTTKEKAVVLQEFYNRQTDEGLTLAAAIEPLVKAAKKSKKISSRSSTAQ